MNIAFYSDTYLPNRDGVVSSILTFRNKLEQEGHNVTIFASGSAKAIKENKDKDVFLYKSAPFKPYPQYRIALFPFFSQSKLKERKVEIVHSHGMATMGIAADIAARSAGVPLVGTLHTLIPNATHYISGGVKQVGNAAEAVAWEYLKWYYNRCDVSTAPSRAVKDMMEKHGIKKVRVLPNGIDTERFNTKISGAGIRKTLKLEDKKVILHLGRLVKEKNLDVLINSALLVLEEEPDARFLVVGSGPASQEYKNLVAKKGISKYFTFTGFVDDSLIPNYYSAADLLAVPSTFETQGLVTLEAMACGTPVVGADALATSEIISNGKNGYLFAPGVPEDCAEKLIKTLSRSKEMATGARKTAESYSIEVCTNRLVNLYKELI